MILILEYGLNLAVASSDQEDSNAAATAQNSSCDFKVEVARPDFCVIQGRVYDIDLAMIPVTGSCDASAVLKIDGLPAGVTQQLILPHQAGSPTEPKIATVRIDTADVATPHRMTYPLTISASQGGFTRTASAKMTLDLPSFDFSITPDPSELLIYQEEVAVMHVWVGLSGAACTEPPPVNLSLHFSSSPLAFTVSPIFSHNRLIPPDVAILGFKAASGPEIGSFVATVAGCCTAEKEERTAEMTLKILPRTLSPHAGVAPLAEDESFEEDALEEAPPFEALVNEGETVKIDTMDNILNDLQLSPRLQEETRQEIETEANTGYIKASDEEMEALKQSKRRVVSIDSVLGTLTFEPVPLTGTPFEQLNMEGAYSTGKHVGKWTSIVRLFTMPDGALVELTEDDIASSGGSKNVVSKEGVDLYLQGFPTSILVQQSPNGAALSRIFWKTTAKSYTLRMEGNVKTNGKKKLFLDLAQSIP